MQEEHYTVEEFNQFLQSAAGSNGLYELVDGSIMDKSLTEEQGVIVTNIGSIVHGYAKQRRSGRVGIAVQYAIPSDPWNVRLPHVMYSTQRRPLMTKGNVPTMPDLAVEVQSPEESTKEMHKKATYYLANGTKMVWLVYPNKQLVEVFTADGEVDIFGDGEVLSGEEVLPGFTLPVADIFDDPFAD